MPRIDPIDGLAFNPYGAETSAPESPGLGELFGAGFRTENPIVSQYRYAQQEPWEADPNFDLTEAARDDELYLNHFKELSAAKSQEEYEWIRGRIAQEEQDRKTLAAGGWAGFAAAATAGMLSPTMLIPGFGPAKGLKGAKQAFALAAAGATADELALMETQFTRTGGEVGVSIAASTVLGGLLGTAMRHMTVRERALVEGDMAGAPDARAILYSTGDGSRIASRSGSAESELAHLTPDEIKIIRAGDAGGDLSAASPTRPITGFYASGSAARQLIEKLGRLNPVTRTVNQPYSKAARAATLQMQDAGLRTEGNLDFAPHAAEGTIEARTKEFTAFEADFIRELDDAYSRHLEGDKLPEGELQKASIARVRAAVKLPEGKLPHEDFNKEVFRVSQTGEVHPDPAVNKGAKAWDKLAGRINALAEEAHEFRLAQDPHAKKLFDPEGNLGPGAEKWVSHVFSPDAIEQRYEEFIQDLMENAESNQLGSFRKAFEKFDKRRKRLNDLIDAKELAPEQAREVYELNETRLQEIMETPEWDNWHGQTLQLRRQQRAAKSVGDDALVEELKEEIAEHLKPDNMGPELLELDEELKQIKAYQKVLGQNAGKLDDRAQELAGKIQELEALDLSALERVTNAGARLGKALEKVDRKTLDREAKKLYKQLGAAMKSVDTQKRLMERVYKGKPLEGKAAFDAYNRMALLSKRRDAADLRANELIEKLEANESFDTQSAKELLRAVQDLNNVRVRDLNAKRALREEKLAQQIEEISPEKQAENLAELRMARDRMEEDFDTTWRQKGAEDLNVEVGAADFRSYAREMAEELAEKIVGLRNPIAGLEILGGKRGPELARTLNMPLATKSKYLETDMEKVSRIYVRRIAPDIELYRAFGSVNAGPVFDQVKQDFRRLHERLSAATMRPAGKANYKRFKQGEALVEPEKEKFIPWGEEEKNAHLAKLLDARRETEADLRVMVTRLRHQRGVPGNANSLAYRAGRTAMDVNVFRFMGSVVLSSVPDVARPVMRYGFSKTLREGYLPFFRNMERVKMGREEARRLGVALDPILHNRAQAVFDMWDDYAARKTVPERVTGFLANKTGFVAGFDRWTAEMKQISASVIMSEMSHALEAVAKTGKATGKQKSFLAEIGIDEPMAHRIWAQMNTEDGGNRIDGITLPNTESWTDVPARRAYAAALNKSVDDTIVTPGLDRPSWVDANIGAKVVSQFRSFTFTATNRTVLRGAQEPDMALFQGITMSLALGALSYYAWSVSRGKGAEALEQDWEKWADEAVARAGLLGIFQEPWDIAQKIPGLSDKVTFSGEQLTQRRASGLLGRVFGPSVDLAERSANVVLGMSEPTQSTLHTMRGLAPYQNVFYLRQLIDKAETAANTVFNIPERRGQ